MLGPALEPHSNRTRTALEPHSNRTLNRCAFKVYRYVASGLLVEQERTSSAFFDAVLAPLGGKRLMDFGEVIGYGLAGRSFWLGPVTTGREAERGASRSRPPAGRRSRLFHDAAVAHGAEVLHAPKECRRTTPGTSVRSCATPTATTSRRCATAEESTCRLGNPVVLSQ